MRNAKPTLRILFQVFGLAIDISHERRLASLLYFAGYLALMLGTESGAAARSDLHIRRHEAAQRTDVLVVHHELVVHAVVAGLVYLCFVNSWHNDG